MNLPSQAALLTAVSDAVVRFIGCHHFIVLNVTEMTERTPT